MPGYTGTIHLTSSDTGAGVVLPTDYTFTAADNGVHSFTNGLLLKTAGSQTVSATDTSASSISGTSGTINVATAPAGSADITLQPATSQLSLGASATFSVQAAISVARLGAWTLDVTYDSSALQPTGCTSDASIGSVCNTAFASNKVRVTGASSGGLTGTPTLASLTFKAVGGAGSTTSLTPAAITLTDTLGNAMTSTTTAGQITIKADTTTQLTSSANPSVAGQTAIFTAGVTSGSNLTIGSVTFLEGNTVLAGPTPLDANGQAALAAAHCRLARTP